MQSNLSLYFHTIRHLRPAQICGKIRYAMASPRPDLRPAPPLRPVAGHWHKPVAKTASLLSSVRLRFLNEEHDAQSRADWNHPARSKLWLYNLHYFDDLNADGYVSRRDWHQLLIERWVRENDPGCGVGWEPYPISLRVVNWIKWALAGNALSAAALHSLAVQTRYLCRRLEYHLLGNHLLANAKAVLFAGYFFEGREADKWLGLGFRILNKEIPIQVLPDGGHFELSPMYHGIVLEDLLDLINISSLYSAAIRMDSAREAVPRMLSWLAAMTHPDGQIALFNDAAFGIAAPPAALSDYARQLGLAPARPEEMTGLEVITIGETALTVLRTSGYIRIAAGPMTAILDTAPLGPDYLPGHAHADTLTFELSLGAQRVVVNGGTSVYGEDVTRREQRGTMAHNTVVVDGSDSSEVWGGFRVARRARPFGLSIERLPSGEVSVKCAHDGYRRLPGRVVHRREWRIGGHSITINDNVEGQCDCATGFIHFDPSIHLEDTGCLIRIRPLFGQEAICRIDEGEGRLIGALYHPEFGINRPNQCLQVNLRDNRSSIVFNW